MLAPNLVETRSDLAFAANAFQRVGSFMTSCQTVQIGTLSDKPCWLDDLHSTIRESYKVAAEWNETFPDIHKGVASGFIHYRNVFDAFQSQAPSCYSEVEALDGLVGRLIDETKTSRDKALDAHLRMTRQQEEIASIHANLRTSLRNAWNAHEEAHESLEKNATAISALYFRLGELTDQATSDDITTGQEVGSLAVKVSLPIFMATGEGIPFVGVGLSILSLTKDIYNTVVTDVQINSTLSDIYGCLQNISMEAQALAASEAILNLLDSLDQQYQMTTMRIPDFSRLWSSEEQRLVDLRQSLRAGADPRLMTEFAMLPAAMASWNGVSEMAQRMLLSPVALAQSAELSPDRGSLSA